MTNNEILIQFDELVDNELSDTLKAQLANTAKNKLETELKLSICQKLDISLTSSSSGTYLTPHSLPTDFFLLSKEFIYVGESKLYPVPMAKREEYKNDSSKFYIDYGQKKLYLCGTQTGTITIPYIYETIDITATDTTSVIWPSRFHPLIPFEMVKVAYAIDAGEKAYSWLPEWTLIYNDLKNRLIDYDAQIKLSEIGGATPYPDDSIV
jgi:hypothetical protein